MDKRLRRAWNVVDKGKVRMWRLTTVRGDASPAQSKEGVPVAEKCLARRDGGEPVTIDGMRATRECRW